MADIRATQSGDFSATTTWVGGVVPGSGDVAYANTFTVTISDTRTVQAISNASGTGITVGGTFSLLNGCNLTCTNANGVVQGNTATSCVTTPNLTTGASATINANMSITATTNNAFTINHSGAGTLNLNGNLTGNASNFISAALLLSGVGIVNTTGTLTGGTSSGGQTVSAVEITGNGTLAHVGNVVGNGGLTTVDRCCGIRMSAGTVSVNGTVQGTGAISNGTTLNSGAGTIAINGTCQAGFYGPTILPGSYNQITRLSGPFLLSATSNLVAVAALGWRWAPTQIPTYYEVPTSGGTTKRNLYTADNIPTANYPTQGNVRSGTVYGPNLENTGTLAVPAPGSVALGVATDNTTGTAVLTSAAVQTALGAFSSGRLNNVATVDTTGAQIQAAVNT